MLTQKITTNTNVKHLRAAGEIECIGSVYATTNYVIFQTYENNRTVNMKRVKGLVEDLVKGHQLQPILVTQDYRILDGHHRFEACKMAGVPVPFIYKTDTHIPFETKVLCINSPKNTATYNLKDTLKLCAANGNEDAITILKLSEEYAIAPSALAGLLSGRDSMEIWTAEKSMKASLHYNLQGQVEKMLPILKVIKDSRPFKAGYITRGLYNLVNDPNIAPHIDKPTLLKALSRAVKSGSHKLRHNCPKAELFMLLAGVYNKIKGAKVAPFPSLN